MVRLTIELSDEIGTKLECRATESGFISVESYAEAVLLATAADGLAADEPLQQLLEKRIHDTRPGIECTPEWMSQFRRTCVSPANLAEQCREPA
jgi:hypothetical protein